MVKALQTLLPAVPTGGFDALRRFVHDRMVRPGSEGGMAKNSKQREFGKGAPRRQSFEESEQMTDRLRKQSTKDMFSEHQAAKPIAKKYSCRCGRAFYRSDNYKRHADRCRQQQMPAKFSKAS